MKSTHGRARRAVANGAPTAAALLAGVLALGVAPAPLAGQALEDAPRLFVGGVPFDMTIRGSEEGISVYRVETALGRGLGDGQVEPGALLEIPDLVVTSAAELPLVVLVGERLYRVSAPFVPGWASVVPPIVAIGLALLVKEVVLSLFAGVWLGALLIYGFNPLLATLRTIDEFVVGALADTSGQTQVIVGSFLLGGMVGVISRNGGIRGIVSAVHGWATSRRRGKVAAGSAGVAVFFDDYASCLIVGTSMRPIMDRLRISREKLAYLVDSTAAPIAAIVPLSTWVGYEISLIADGLRIAANQQQLVDPALGAALVQVSPLAVFIQTIPYRFYPLLTLWLVFLTSWMNRDLGPMAAAEARAASGGGVSRPGAVLLSDPTADALSPSAGTRERWWNAGVPVLVVIAVVLWGLYATGRAAAASDAGLLDVLGAADPFGTLLWGTFAGCLTAVVLSVGQRILSLREAAEAVASGMRAMLLAVVVLVLAWSLGSVTETLGTAEFLSLAIGPWLPPVFLPALVFVLAAAVSFATGTSWGTMAILMPIAIPLTVSIGGGVGFETGDYTVLLGVISSVLAGAIFGDHCSPISDTTILSSTASGCDHLDHVRTQLPYALLVAAVTVPLGDVATAFGLSPWIAIALCAALLFAILRWKGKVVPEGAEGDVSAAPERTLEEGPRTLPLERPA
jgi:Na+/H+ antiporter NhaC